MGLFGGSSNHVEMLRVESKDRSVVITRGGRVRFTLTPSEARDFALRLHEEANWADFPIFNPAEAKGNVPRGQP